MFESLIKKYHW